ncbi:MAG: hypothetical protein ABGW66_04400 [Flavobacteriaceae bacterium]
MSQFVEKHDEEDYTILSSKMCTGDICVCPDRDIELVKQSDDSMIIKGLKRSMSFKTLSL